MKHVWAAQVALILASACASTPPDPNPAAVAAAKPAAASAKKAPVSDPDKVVCKTQKVIGRVAPIDICHTKAQWAQIRKDETETVKDAQEQRQAQSGVHNPEVQN